MLIIIDYINCPLKYKYITKLYAILYESLKYNNEFLLSI